ncbi:MAG: hypothetical protein WC676_05555 [Candidatus Omnitrophota bacterium]
MMIKQIFLLLWAITAAGAMFPDASLACSVCYGAPGSLLTKGLNFAIFCLLGVVFSVLASFAIFFLTLRKKSKEAATH